MASYFADTTFWIAIVDRRDSLHARAIEWSQSRIDRIVTTEAVLLETVNAMSRPTWREKVVALVNHLAMRADVEIVPFSDALWSQGWTLFSQRPDKAWSLTDCISFEVMRQRGHIEALSADSHFTQAGLQALLIDSR